MSAPLAALLSIPGSPVEPDLLGALARAAAAIARLDQASHHHALLPALLHRARLDAVCRQAAVDGQLIDPWHLAALIEGLRPRQMVGAHSIAEAGEVFEAGRAALALHRWLTAPDPDWESEVQAAATALEAGGESGVAVLDAAMAAWRWLDQGGARAPLRAALVRHWVGTGLLRVALPLTGAAALRAEVAWNPGAWIPVFLQALADEAEHSLALLQNLEHGWTAARSAVTGRRRHSRTPVAVDLLAAVPLLSATTLASALGISIKSALAILEALAADGVVVEVTGRAARRLFGLHGLAPLAAAVAPPRRPVPGRGRGRPRNLPVAEETPPSLPRHTFVARPAFDYGDLDVAMQTIDAAIRGARRALDDISGRGDTARRCEAHEDDRAKDPDAC